MPTYDYVCNACGHRFELFQSMNDGVKRKCPECSKLKLERLIGTGAAILFKGSGFYQTDYRSDSYKEGASSETKGDSKSDKKSDSKTDSKSDSPSGSKSGSDSSTKADAKPAKKKRDD